MSVEWVQPLAGMVSGLIGLAGYIPYIRGIITGRVHPSPVSWLIWALLGVVSLTGQAEGGAGFGLIVTVCTTAGCALIVVLALKGTSISASLRATTGLDRTCLLGAVAALILLTTQTDPGIAVVLSNTVGAVGFIPTVVKALRDPWSEGISVYAYAALKFGLSLAALPNWNLLTVLYPGLCLTEELAVVILLLASRRRRSHQKPAPEGPQAGSPGTPERTRQ